MNEGFEVMLCGDFNLYPDTESMRILEAGVSQPADSNDSQQNEKIRLRNLVTENKVNTTRNRHANDPDELSDYILVSQGIEVDDFRVEYESDISDHLPLVVKFH